jgi:hypothetical protein
MAAPEVLIEVVVMWGDDPATADVLHVEHLPSSGELPQTVSACLGQDRVTSLLRATPRERSVPDCRAFDWKAQRAMALSLASYLIALAIIDYAAPKSEAVAIDATSLHEVAREYLTTRTEVDPPLGAPHLAHFSNSRLGVLPETAAKIEDPFEGDRALKALFLTYDHRDCCFNRWLTAKTAPFVPWPPICPLVRCSLVWRPFAGVDPDSRQPSPLQVTGALSWRDVYETLNRGQRAVERCYGQALIETSGLRRDLLDLRFLIWTTGEVRGVVADSTLAGPVLERCATQVVQNWTFTATTRGSTVVTYRMDVHLAK